MAQNSRPMLPALFASSVGIARHPKAPGEVAVISECEIVPDLPPVQIIAPVDPHTARECAKALLRCADDAERAVKPPEVPDVTPEDFDSMFRSFAEGVGGFNPDDTRPTGKVLPFPRSLNGGEFPPYGSGN